jgi:NAD(P)H-dependent FMN reductase
MPQVLIVNGSLGGSRGNTAELLAFAEEALAPVAGVTHLELVREPPFARVLAEIERADAFLFGTGTYWDSWGSPLQRFFEETAATEGTDLWLGKPAGAIVTAHAVGAKSVLSRLLGVLNVFGMIIPPMAGLTYTHATHVAYPHATSALKDELWSLADVAVVTHNLVECIRPECRWKQWPHSEGLSGEKWLTAYSDQIRD